MMPDLELNHRFPEGRESTHRRSHRLARQPAGKKNIMPEPDRRAIHAERFHPVGRLEPDSEKADRVGSDIDGPDAKRK
jgi:hypothetical protein